MSRLRLLACSSVLSGAILAGAQSPFIDAKADTSLFLPNGGGYAVLKFADTAASFGYRFDQGKKHFFLIDLKAKFDDRTGTLFNGDRVQPDASIGFTLGNRITDSSVFYVKRQTVERLVTIALNSAKGAQAANSAEEAEKIKERLEGLKKIELSVEFSSDPESVRNETLERIRKEKASLEAKLKPTTYYFLKELGSVNPPLPTWDDDKVHLTWRNQTVAGTQRDVMYIQQKGRAVPVVAAEVNGEVLTKLVKVESATEDRRKADIKFAEDALEALDKEEAENEDNQVGIFGLRIQGRAASYSFYDKSKAFNDAFSKKSFEGWGLTAFYNGYLPYITYGASIGWERDNNVEDLDVFKAVDRTTIPSGDPDDPTVRIVEKERKGYIGSFDIVNRVPLRFDVMYRPKQLGSQVGINFAGRVDLGESHERFRPGVGVFLLKPGAPTNVIGGLVVTFEDGKAVGSIVAGLKF